MTHRTRRLPSGAVLQSAVPSREVPADGLRAYGLKLRGVVMATYVLDDPSHPEASREPVAVYCDVMTYGGPSWMQRGFFPRALVSQEIGGMHRGRLWKPRASTIDISSTGLDMRGPGVNPANLDGDHVLLGFINDSLSQPIIERGIPHPNADAGFDPNTESEVRGHLKLRLTDGDPDLYKHAGSLYGLMHNGEYLVNTLYAYGDRAIDERGNEPGPAQDGEGQANFLLPDAAEFVVLFADRSSLPTLNLLAGLEVTKTRLQYRSQDPDVVFKVTQDGVPAPGDETVIQATKSGASAECKIGDGAVHAAQVEKLETLYNQLKAALDAHDAAFPAHTHQAGGLVAGTVAVTGITGTATPATIGAPGWDPGINSSKVSFPDG